MAITGNGIVKGLNVICGALLVTAGVFQFLWFTFQSTVIGIYAIFFGVMIILSEFSFANKISGHAALSFLNDPLGRGFFYIFWGIVNFSPYGSTFLFATGIILMVLGVYYVIANFAKWPISSSSSVDTSSSNTKTTPAPATTLPGP